MYMIIANFLFLSWISFFFFFFVGIHLERNTELLILVLDYRIKGCETGFSMFNIIDIFVASFDCLSIHNNSNYVYIYIYIIV